MRELLQESIQIYMSRHRAKNIFRKFLRAAACVVAFVTTYALILPAITLEQEAFCGLEEHTHESACYQLQVEQRICICSAGSALHVHGDECYDENGRILCGQADYLVHTHDTSCYNALEELVCPLPERSQHIHGEGCYMIPDPVPHVHTDACMADMRGELICGQDVSSGHHHTAICYQPGSELQCNIVEGHLHEGSCYVPELICTESTQPHYHDNSCYIAGGQICNVPEEHVHQGACFETVLICTQTEYTHTHEDTCYSVQLICSEDHEHTEECWQNELVCTLSEAGHLHGDGCWEVRTQCNIPEGHIHDSGCYECILSCSKAEGEAHCHTEVCYSSQMLLNCSLEEKHIHSDGCYVPELSCGIAESDGHEHSDTCYHWTQEPVCGLEEGQPEEVAPILVCTAPEAQVHIHDASCFEISLTEAETLCGEDHEHTLNCYPMNCSLLEHTHTLPCYSDPNADVETWQYWESTMRHVSLTGDWNRDVVSIAESQLGYTESIRNYAVWEDGSVHGYTRYGAWYGVPYGDWCAMFVSFCLDYAGVEGMPYNYGVRPWIHQLSQPDLDLYRTAESYMPVPGDLVFFDWEGDSLSDHVGIVYQVTESAETGSAKLKTIEGNSSNRVQIVTYDLRDPVLLGYSKLPEKNTIEQPLKPEYYCGLELHEHGEICYDADGNLTCQMEVHQHDEDCFTEAVTEPTYYCGLEAHEHGESCYDADGNLTCQLEVHQHSEDCYAEPAPEQLYYCGLQEHTHEMECYDDALERICGLEEHVHDEQCLRDEPDLTVMTLSAQIYTDSTYETLSEDTMKIVVTGILPADAVIRAYPIELDTQMQVLCAYEIEILIPDGTVYEPAEGESLNVTFQSNILVEQEDMQVYYIPEEGAPEAVDSTITEDGIAFEAPHFSVYAVMTTAEEALEPFDNGKLTYAWNTVADAFIYDPQYAAFYNAASPLGTAGSFHIVGFGTVTLNSHTNGNILAHTLYAPNNFGTNSKNNVDLVEISYVQNYLQVNHNSSADTGDYLVIGSNNTVTKINVNASGFDLAVNNTKIDKPYNIIQDVNTEEVPFINLARVEAEINAIAANLSSYETSDDSVIRAVTTGSDPYLELVSPDNVGVYNLTSAQLQMIQGSDGWDMRGFATGSNGAIVINVDCSQADRSRTLKIPKSRVYVDGVMVPLEETLDFSAGKVIWNLVNASGLQIETTELTGMVIASGATVNINANLNGTVVAENVNVNAESHRTDFAGRVIPTEHIDGAHIHVYKVDKNNYGKFLSGAKFILYEWNGTSWVTASQNSQDQIHITDSEGKVIFQDLTYNVAYKLEETQAPPGYRISTDYQYYYFEHPDTVTYPVRKPSDFSQSSTEDCIMHYYPNEVSQVEVTSLHLEKKWQDTQGNDLSVAPIDRVTVDIIKEVYLAKLDADGNIIVDENGRVEYEDAVTEPVQVADTVEICAADGWILTVNNLPLTSEDRKEKYVYSARETGSESAQMADENGLVTIINQAEVIYVPLSVQKHWEGETDVTEVSFRLFRMSRSSETESWSEPEVILEPIRLSDADNWQWQAEDDLLIRQMTYADESVFFAYYLEEISVPEGFYPDYHGITSENPYESGAVDDRLKVTNREIQYQDMKISKSWLDNDGELLKVVPENSINVTVEQSADGGETWIPYLENLEIHKSDNWQAVIQALPLQDQTGRALSYRVVESPLAGYQSSGGEMSDNGEVRLTNRQIETTALTIRKVWKDLNGDIMTMPPLDSVEVQLLRSVNDGPWEAYDSPITVKSEDDWSITVTGLPSSDPAHGETYRYSLKELTISDLYKTSISEVSGDTITVTNSRVIEATDIAVVKRWFNNNGAEYYANSGSVEVKLYQLHQSSNGQGSTSGNTVNVTVNIGRWWSDGSFWNQTYAVPAGTKFTVQYSIEGNGYKLAVNDLNNSSSQLTPVSVVPSDSGYLVTFEYVANQSGSLVGLLGYYRDGTVNVSYSSGTPIETVNLSVANNWQYLFPDLPRYSYDDSGNITGTYTYFLEETGGGQYNATYSDSNGNLVSADNPIIGGTVTIRNTLPENSYVLPKTGGIGTMMYQGLGFLLTVVSLLFLMHIGKQRREVSKHP